MAKLEFAIDKIMSVTDARNNFNKIVEDVEKDPEGKFLLTKGGKPSVAMVNSSYLEKLMGERTEKNETKEQKVEPQPRPAPSEKTPPLKIAQELPTAPTPTATPTPPVSPNSPSSSLSETSNSSQPPADQENQR